MGGRSRKYFFDFFFVVSGSAEGSRKVLQIRGHPRKWAKPEKSENVRQISTFLKSELEKIDFEIEFSKSPRPFSEASHKVPRNKKSRRSDSICDVQPMTGEHNWFRIFERSKYKGIHRFPLGRLLKTCRLRLVHLSWVGSRKSSPIDEIFDFWGPCGMLQRMVEAILKIRFRSRFFRAHF